MNPNNLEARGLALQELGYSVHMMDDEGQWWSCDRLLQDYEEGRPRPCMMGWEIVLLEVRDPRTGHTLKIRRS